MSTTTRTTSGTAAPSLAAFEQVQDVRNDFFHFRSRRLLRDPVSELAAGHVLAGDGSPGLGL